MIFERIRAVIGRSGRSGIRDNPAAGAVMVIVAMAFLAGLVGLGRYLALEGMAPSQVLFFRTLLCVVLMLPLLWVRGPSLMQTNQLRLYGSRVGLSFVSMMGMFHAAAWIPIGTVTAIGFLAPLFGTVFAVFLVGEVVRARRVGALFVGFIGAMIVLRPTTSALGAGQIAALVSAVSLGLIGPLVKKLTLNDDADRIVFLTNVFLLPLTMVPALFVWQWPEPELWPYLLGLGVCALLGHMCLVRGYELMDATLVMTFKFVRLPFAVLIGYLAFSETIDQWTWLGAAIIFLASAYITHREARLKSQERAN